MSDTQAIIVERVLPHAADTIWRALTNSEMIARWLMPNDFVALVGHRFNFRTQPRGDWDGVVHCEVLACDPPHMLRYSWKGGTDNNPKYGSRLDTIVTWTLTTRGDGTHVRMEHTGFRLPDNQSAFDAMSPGWGQVLDRLAGVAAEIVPV
jgi:uncharacterized protein YndB with AHSA1/START domain